MDASKLLQNSAVTPRVRLYRLPSCLRPRYKALLTTFAVQILCYTNSLNVERLRQALDTGPHAQVQPVL